MVTYDKEKNKSLVLVTLESPILLFSLKSICKDSVSLATVSQLILLISNAQNLVHRYYSGTQDACFYVTCEFGASDVIRGPTDSCECKIIHKLCSVVVRSISSSGCPGFDCVPGDLSP